VIVAQFTERLREGGCVTRRDGNSTTRRSHQVARGAVPTGGVDAHFTHGKVANWFTGSSDVTTHLLYEMHYRGLPRVARREGGTRIYAARKVRPDLPDPSIARARFDALVDIVMNMYASFHILSLGHLLSQLAGNRVAGIGALATQRRRAAAHTVRPPRLGSPPLQYFLELGLSIRRVHPSAQTQAGVLFFAPALTRPSDWFGGNLTVTDVALRSSFGYTDGRLPRDAVYRSARDAELARMSLSLRLS
jgi:hypothetical protein